MITAFKEDFESIQNIIISPENEKQLRDKLFTLLAQIHSVVPDCKNFREIMELREINRSCLRILRKLQNKIICSRPENSLAPVSGDILLLVERLVCASNLLLFGCGPKIGLEAPQIMPKAGFEPFLVESILMNLISNACKFSKEGDVQIRAIPSHYGLNFSVVNTGEMRDMSRQIGSVEFSGGLGAVRRAATLHGGAAVFSSGNGMTSAAVSLKFPESAELPGYEPPELTHLFTDRLSPLYIGLCEICACPI